MPNPSTPNFYPSSSSAYPSYPNVINKGTVSDSGTTADGLGLNVAWTLNDSALGSETVSGNFGTVTSYTVNEFGLAADSVTVSRTRPVLFPPPGPRIEQVKVPEQRLLLADTRTGRIHFELPFTKLSWSQKINAAGTATATIPLEQTLDALSRQGADNPARVIWGFITGPLRYSLVVAYGNMALWAGPLNPTDEIPSGNSIDIGATELPSLLSGRMLVKLDGTGSWADPSRDVTFNQTTQTGLIYQIVSFAISKGVGYELPIYCDNVPQLVGQTNYNYLAYDQVDCLKAIQNQAAGADGPDFRFDPFLYVGADAQYLGYNLRIGNPYLDYGAKVTFDDSTSIVAVSGDAVGMTSTLFALGSGQDRDKKIGSAQSNAFVDLGFPAVEAADSSRNAETDLDVLNAYAAGAITAQRSPTLTWNVRSLAAEFPFAGTFHVGDLAAVDVREHRLIDGGLYNSRIVALSGDDGPWITSVLSMTEDTNTGSL